MSRSFHPFGRPGWRRPISHSVHWTRWRRFVRKAYDHRVYFNPWTLDVDYGPSRPWWPACEPWHERRRTERSFRTEWRRPKPDWDDYTVPDRRQYRIPYGYWW